LARAINWERDRIRELAKRATAEEIEDQKRLGYASCGNKFVPRRSKTADRAFAEEVTLRHQAARKDLGPRGSWQITCEHCGATFTAQVAFSTALETVIPCRVCEQGHWLLEEDLEIPWE
jgi:hypothetical protein